MSAGLDTGYEELLIVKISEEISELLIADLTKIIEKTSWLRTEVIINGQHLPNIFTQDVQFILVIL